MDELLDKFYASGATEMKEEVMLHRWIQLFTWRSRRQMRFACAHLIAVLCASMSLAQVRTTPTQVPNVTAPGPQPPAQAQPQRQQPLPGTRVPQPILQTPGAGTVEGFVYWDTASISHSPASSCSGLAVTVAVGNSSGGKSNAYKPLATLTNNFKFVGQVKQFLGLTCSAGTPSPAGQAGRARAGPDDRSSR